MADEQESNLVTLQLPAAQADTYRLWADVAGLPLPVLLGALIEHGVVILADATIKQEPMPCTPETTRQLVDRLLSRLHKHLRQGKLSGPPLP